jgi:hypothetical protein
MLGRDLDIAVIPMAIQLVLDANVREVHLVIEVREVVFERPAVDFLVRAVRMAVVVIAITIALMQPPLVLTPKLVVEDDPLDIGATLLEALGFAFVGAIDLDVMLQFPLASEPVVEPLAAIVVPFAMALQDTAAFLRQHHGMLARAGHTNGVDQTLFAQMAEIA